MKKLNFAILGALLLTCLSKQAFAETTIPWTKEGCESVKGHWLTAHAATDSNCDTAHCNNRNFCGSPMTMTWFSALTWCQSIGHKLADFGNACPGNTPVNNTTCQNLNAIRDYGYNFHWTTLVSGNSNAFGIELRYGRISAASGDHRGMKTNFRYALCEE